MLRRSLIIAALAAALAAAVQGRKLSQGPELQAMTGALAPAAPLLEDALAPALPPAMDGADMSAAAGTADAAGVLKITLDEVAQHSSEGDAWIAVDGKVYDVTEWVPLHPGGPDKILGIAGTDATARFSAQHGIPSPQFDILSTYYIGDLA